MSLLVVDVAVVEGADPRPAAAYIGRSGGILGVLVMDGADGLILIVSIYCAARRSAVIGDRSKADAPLGVGVSSLITSLNIWGSGVTWEHRCIKYRVLWCPGKLIKVQLLDYFCMNFGLFYFQPELYLNGYVTVANIISKWATVTTSIYIICKNGLLKELLKMSLLVVDVAVVEVADSRPAAA